MGGGAEEERLMGGVGEDGGSDGEWMMSSLTLYRSFLLPSAPPRFPFSNRTIFRHVQLCVCVCVCFDAIVGIVHSYLLLLISPNAPPLRASHDPAFWSSASEMLITWVTVASQIMPLFPWQPPVKSNSLPEALHHFSMTLATGQISFNVRAAVFMGCPLMDEPKREWC